MDSNEGSPGKITVRPMHEADRLAWDRFVLSVPHASFFHRSGWQRIFERIFRLNTHYLLSERDGAITGVLPLVHQSSLLFGSELSSAPFCVEGGPAASDSESGAALLSAALDLRQRLKANYLEFRSRIAHNEGATVRSDLYATFEGPISASDEGNLKSISRKQRAVVRRAIEGPLRSEVDCDVRRFFRVYSESVRNLGTPVFPKRYFAALLTEFGNDCDVVVVTDHGRPVAAVLNFYFRETVLPYYGGGTRHARKTGANDFLYWEVIRRAAARGFRRFDFGRSKVATGAFAFKKNWGFEPHWLQYEYWIAPGHSLPEKNPSNPRYRLLIEAWKRLPLPIANALGPFLVRSLG